MSEPFLGEIRRVAFPNAPTGWALCNGQLLSISANQALFALLGTTYGGDGVQTFGLPDLRGRGAIHPGNGIAQGTRGGEESHVLTSTELPAHTHTVRASKASGTQQSPAGGYWAQTDQAGYGTSAGGVTAPGAIASTGGGQAHENRSPYLVVNHIIALAGIFPSQN